MTPRVPVALLMVALLGPAFCAEPAVPAPNVLQDLPLVLNPVVPMHTVETPPKPATPEPKKQDIVISPEVNNCALTFRYKAPKAKQVSVQIEGFKQHFPMHLDDRGIWSLTLDPLKPEIYEYRFKVDEIYTLDSKNPWVKDSIEPSMSMVEIPAATPHPWEARDVPHGAISIHPFRSKALGTWRSFRVYTPPDYHARPNEKFPVLYLLHGRGDQDGGWSVVGRANLIADNLLAENKMKPMLIVMPNGMYPLTKGHESDFETDLLQCVIPAVENTYRVLPGAKNRALAGLSMGAEQTFNIGMKHKDTFAWLGAFSNGLKDDSLPAFTESLAGANEKLSLLWIAIGEDDFLLKRYRKLESILEEKRINRVSKVTLGSHNWRIWRRYLGEFLPLLFR